MDKKERNVNYPDNRLFITKVSSLPLLLPGEKRLSLFIKRLNLFCKTLSLFYFLPYQDFMVIK